MAEPYLGQLMLVGFNFAPQNWAFCNGQLLSIKSYTALYSLLGTTYGGDGVNNFALPDLRSRVPVCMGQGNGLSSYTIGQQTGAEWVTLTTQQMPSHYHGITVDATPGSTASPSGGNIAQVNTGTSKTPSVANSYTPGNATNAVPLNAQTIQPQGGSQGHPNIQPVLAMNYIICTAGIYPPRS